MALEAGSLDEPARRVTGRVREHRARVLAPRLVLATPSDDLGDLGLGRIRVARRHGEVGPEDDVVARHARVAPDGTA